MKLLFHAGVIVVSALLFAVNAAEPNYVKTTVVGVGKDSNGSSTDQISISFTDGRGRNIQSKINNSSVPTTENGSIPSGTTFLTSCTFYDDVGRPVKTTKPFVSTDLSYLPGNFTVINAILKNEYKDFPKDANDDPFAYSETKYYDNPLSQVYKTASPGVKNNIESDGIEASWNFGVGLETKSITVSVDNIQWSIPFKDGFIVTILTRQKLDLLYTRMLTDATVFEGEANYILSITRDAGGKYTQVLKDRFGRVVATAFLKDAVSNELVISKAESDFFGKCLKETPPDEASTLNSSLYKYNTLGQLREKELPDGNIDVYEYDNNGLLVLEKKVMRQNDGTEVIVNQIGYTYDKLNRLCSIYDPLTLQNFVTNYYDNTDVLLENSVYKIPDAVLKELRNTRAKLVAAVSHCGNSTLPKNIIDLYSYDNYGNVEFKIKMVPGIPLQRIAYTYDVHGKIINERTTIGSTVSEKVYVYDELGRLKNITHQPDSKLLISYTYDKFSRLLKKNNDDDLVTQYRYTILGQVDSIGSKLTNPIFEQRLEYLPDGKIASDTALYSGWNGAPADKITKAYTYDLLNRLTDVDATDDRLDGAYQYDDIGRFTSKVEGVSTIDGYSSLTGYDYYAGTSQLKKAKATSTDNDYLYDIFGNMVVDKQKKMIIEYDWRNLPVKFSFYNAIPSAIQNEKMADGQTDKGIFTISGYTVTKHNSSELAAFMRVQVAASSGTSLLSTVTMLYDAGGMRVMKIESKL